MDEKRLKYIKRLFEADEDNQGIVFDPEYLPQLIEGVLRLVESGHWSNGKPLDAETHAAIQEMLWGLVEYDLARAPKN